MFNKGLRVKHIRNNPEINWNKTANVMGLQTTQVRINAVYSIFRRFLTTNYADYR